MVWFDASDQITREDSSHERVHVSTLYVDGGDDDDDENDDSTQKNVRIRSAPTETEAF